MQMANNNIEYFNINQVFCAIFLSFLVSFLSYYLIEKPLIKINLVFTKKSLI